MLTGTKADWNLMTWEEATSNPLNAYRASKVFAVSIFITSRPRLDHADHFRNRRKLHGTLWRRRSPSIPSQL
jgi:hypothetical protein